MRSYKELVIIFNLLCIFVMNACREPSTKADQYNYFDSTNNTPSFTENFTPPPTQNITQPVSSITPDQSEALKTKDCPYCWIFPDSEIVYSPTTIDFSTSTYLNNTNGFLSTYQQYLMITGWTSGAEIVERVAIENSINPRLLLALLEYQSGSVLGQPVDADTFNTALGFSDYYRKDLYGQLVRAVNILSKGFYGWQTGTLKEISFPDGLTFSPHSDNNAGSVALQYFFAQFHSGDDWEQDLNPETGFPALYNLMFEDVWSKSTLFDPLIPKDLSQPVFSLPFESDTRWAFSGGPHLAFEGNGPLAALDFCPPMSETGCHPSNEWVVAIADGLVVRSEFGVVIQDLDGDGFEQTGWSILYLHIDERDRVPRGTNLHAGEHLGHPSCEGGRATGTHLHIARKYNGVWLVADGEIPFVLDGWRAVAGDTPYLGSLNRGGDTVIANQFGSASSIISIDTKPDLQTTSE